MLYNEYNVLEALKKIQTIDKDSNIRDFEIALTELLEEYTGTDDLEKAEAIIQYRYTIDNMIIEIENQYNISLDEVRKLLYQGFFSDAINMIEKEIIPKYSEDNSLCIGLLNTIEEYKDYREQNITSIASTSNESLADVSEKVTSRLDYIKYMYEKKKVNKYKDIVEIETILMGEDLLQETVERDPRIGRIEQRVSQIDEEINQLLDAKDALVADNFYDRNYEKERDKIISLQQIVDIKTGANLGAYNSKKMTGEEKKLSKQLIDYVYNYVPIKIYEMQKIIKAVVFLDDDSPIKKQAINDTIKLINNYKLKRKKYVLPLSQNIHDKKRRTKEEIFRKNTIEDFKTALFDNTDMRTSEIVLLFSSGQTFYEYKKQIEEKNQIFKQVEEYEEKIDKLYNERKKLVVKKGKIEKIIRSQFEEHNNQEATVSEEIEVDNIRQCDRETYERINKLSAKEKIKKFIDKILHPHKNDDFRYDSLDADYVDETEEQQQNQQPQQQNEEENYSFKEKRSIKGLVIPDFLRKKNKKIEENSDNLDDPFGEFRESEQTDESKKETSPATDTYMSPQQSESVIQKAEMGVKEQTIVDQQKTIIDKDTRIAELEAQLAVFRKQQEQQNPQEEQGRRM